LILNSLDFLRSFVSRQKNGGSFFASFRLKRSAMCHTEPVEVPESKTIYDYYSKK